MKTSDFLRAAQETLRRGELNPAVARELIRLAEAAHGELGARLTKKIVSRHRRRPGKPRDPERDKRIRSAAAWVKFGYADAEGRDARIKKYAKEFNVTENALRHAVEGKKAKFRGLTEADRTKPPLLKLGDGARNF